METPYILAARDYFEAGWSPIPLPRGQKDPVPDDYTGVAGAYVTEEVLAGWLAGGKAHAGRMAYAPGNVALRLPATVLGIDVDAYIGKDGAATLASAEENWGPLPDTWVTTSRLDGVSGIRLFTIPEGLSWPGKLPQGGGVEILRWDHRYAVVAPSVHPNGSPYRWYRSIDGTLLEAEEEIPEPDSFPPLPVEWVEGLTSGVRWRERAVDEEMDSDALNRWMLERPDPDVLCRAMRATVSKYTLSMQKASDDGGVHDQALTGAWAALNDAKAGHSGIKKALASLRNVFLKAVEGRRADEGAAKSEWRRLVQRGGAKVTADDNPEVDEDPCESIRELRPRVENPDGTRRVTSNDINWRLDDVGNADRLIRVMNGRGSWVEALNSWLIWNGKTWAADDSRQVERWAVKAINEMSEELAFLEGEAKESLIKAFKAHMKSSSTVGKVKAMIEMAKGRRGIIIPAEEFDADPNWLACANGVLELREEGVEFRGFHAEQRITLSTGVDYKPEARSAMWEDFLGRFLPDEEVRTWLQRLVGYSLLGSNPARLLVALVGRSSTGKTTFAEAIRTALGGYAGPMVASIMRDNADDKPRPDLLDALSKRLVIAEELSAAQHLHPDQIKRLTGGSLISARGMRANSYYRRRPAFTPWLVTNETPTIEGADEALKRRILVVPFDVQIPRALEARNYLTRLLETSLEAILAWVVKGYEMYVERPDLAEIPVGAMKANLKFASELSDFHTFISDACDTGPDYSEGPSLLFVAYEHWCELKRVKERDRVSSTKFGRSLGSLGFDKDRAMIDGKQTWVRTGIRLTEKYRKIVGKVTGLENSNPV